MTSNDDKSPARWLLRLPQVFAGFTPEVLTQLGAGSPKALSGGWQLVKLPDPRRLQNADAALFIAWRLPVEHSWPCCPEKTENFIEKAAQALVKKFAPREPQAILVGPLEAGAQNKYYKSLASNLRGRTLQLFPGVAARLSKVESGGHSTLESRATSAEEQDPARPSLFVLVGHEGLFAGMSTPCEANGFHPGGVKFIRQGEGMISRAGAKIAEALHWLRLHREPLAAGCHWMELGASPGGMTAELLERGYSVTAVDRAPLDARLMRAPGLTFVRVDAAEFRQPAGMPFDALLCDLNGDAFVSMRTVIRLSPCLRPGGLVVFTLKTAGAETLPEILALVAAVKADAAKARLAFIAGTHLNYNRHEFTLCFERR